MRIRRARQQDTDEPRGVRIIHGDGTVTECALARDPQDQDGYAAWIAVPPAGCRVDASADCLQIDYLPGRTVISLALAVE